MKQKQINLYLSEEMFNRFTVACKALETNKSMELRRLIKKFVKDYELGILGYPLGFK